MKIRFLPKEIATQIVFLVILSAIIFHLCISAAFLVGSGFFQPRDLAIDNGVINHVRAFLHMADQLAPQKRDQMIAWLKEDAPWLDINNESPDRPETGRNQTDSSVQIGSFIGINRKTEIGKQKRIDYHFEDGTSISFRIPPRPPHGPGFDHPPPPPGNAPSQSARQGIMNGPPQARMPPGEFGFNHPPPPPPNFMHSVHEVSRFASSVFGTLLSSVLSFTIFLLWAVFVVTRPLRKFADAVDHFTLNDTTMVLDENGPTELSGAARALNRMRQRVKAMIEQRTQMLAAISHDLRTPVTRLRLRAEFIEQAYIREAILRDIEQMNAMIQSALSYIRDGVEVQRNALLDLNALLHMVRDEFTDLGYNVVLFSACQSPVRGNLDELHRALTNLVGNAVKFGNRVEIHARRVDQDYIEIDVIDDGPGIPEEQKAMMLAPFSRGDTAQEIGLSQGFGLGLPIVQAIVAAHHGLFNLFERSPHGLIARIRLPIR